MKNFLSPEEVDVFLQNVRTQEWRRRKGSPAAYSDPDIVAGRVGLEEKIYLIEKIASYEYGTNAQRYDDTGLFNKWSPGDKLEAHFSSGISFETGTADVEMFVASDIVKPPPAIMYSSTIYLNDDYEGGETRFPKQNYKTKPEPGTLIMFPATCMYPHEVKEVTSGVRYTYSLFLSDASIADVFLQMLSLVRSLTQNNK